MKPIILVIIAMSLGALVVGIIGGNYFVQNQTIDAEPWFGLNCDEMIDFSGSDEHQDITMDQHMEFHQYYYEHCSEGELVKP